MEDKQQRTSEKGSSDGYENQDRDENEVAFLRARIVEAARDGDTTQIKYLTGISAAKRLLSACDESSRWSLLHFSCSRGFFDITLMLLEAGANPLTALDKHGKTCLHIATLHDQRDIILLLLERHSVSNWPKQSKLTLGQTAARAGRRAGMELLLRYGLDPNERGKRSETPLHQASRHGHAGVIELLLQHGADVTAREDWAGRTPLHYACQSGSFKAALVLIVKGEADPHVPDFTAAKQTPLEVAVVSGYRALSHRLVIVVNNRQKAEEKKQALVKSSTLASRETIRRETRLAKNRVSALRGNVAAKRSLVRLEKQQLVDTLRGQLTRAHARLHSLQTQHERLTWQNEISSKPAVDSTPIHRPSTCAFLPSTSRPQGGKLGVGGIQTSFDAGHSKHSRGSAPRPDVSEKGRKKPSGISDGKPCVRMVWGEGESP